MFVSALFDPLSIFVLVAIILMALVSIIWHVSGRAQFHALEGGLKMLRRVGLELAPNHPIRKRLESAPIVDLAFEEIAQLMTGKEAEPAARALIRLRERLNWIERFSQYAIHLGILGTVFALVSSDPTDLEAFRARLPLALGTTFWGLIGAIILSTIAGAAETVLERGNHMIRQALLDSLDTPSGGAERRHAEPASAVVLDDPNEDSGDDTYHGQAVARARQSDNVTHIDIPEDDLGGEA